MEVTFLRDWAFAHNGHRIVYYKAGEVHDLDGRCLEVALADGAGKLKAETPTDEPKTEAGSAPASSRRGRRSKKKTSRKTAD